MLAMCGYFGMYVQRNSALLSSRSDGMYRKWVSVVVCLFVNCRSVKARWMLSEVS